MKRDQRGFTIVELLIAVAILSIVVAAVCGFILVGSRSYAAGNSDINVQQQAQLALNQMSDVMIDTTRSVNYVGYDASGNPVTALKDAEFTFTPEDKSLILFNGVVEGDPTDASTQTVAAGNGNKHYHFYWSKADETLYYTELTVDPDNDVDTKNIHFPAFDPTDPDWVELVSHVTDFSVDLSQVEEKRVVQLALTFLDGRKEYVTSNNVTIRNKVGVNDAKLAPLNKKKTLSVAARDSGVIIEPGEEYHFSTPKVTGENVADKSVTWSLVTSNSPSGQTRFTDTVNGILQVAEDEPAGTIEVAITTNAVDSDGNHASCTVTVNVKRVTKVSLSKTADSNAENGPLQISPGCTFTISANVTGNKLGEVCSVCGDDTSIDKTVGHDGTAYPWLIHNPSAVPGATTKWDPTPYLEVIESEADHATFKLKPDAPTSDPNVPGQNYTVVIQAASLLSVTGNAYHRHYDPVFGAIELTFVKNKTGAKPMAGGLSYATDNEENLHNEMKLDVLNKEIRPGTGKYVPESTYVVCMNVVENSGQEPVRTLLYSMTEGGADFRIAPDLLDLDLDNSYTFYIQALCPVSKDNLLYGNDHQVDSEEEIWNEYWANTSHEAPFDYYGDKYVYGDVYYGALDKPRAIWNYKGNDYEETDLTLDPVNIYMMPDTNGILLGNIQPYKYKNIWHTDLTQKMMTYSVFVEGDSGARTPVYTFNDGEGVMKYEGSTILGDGAAKIQLGDGPGQPTNPSEFMITTQGGNKLKLCGKYHIVPGFCYENKVPGRGYRIIGWNGFRDCDYAPGKQFELPRKLKHYEFSNSVIHFEITSKFTMEINHSQFTGNVMFPLPEEMKASPLFPNIYSSDPQISGSLTVAALPKGWSSGYNITFVYVRYQYFKKDNVWKVEPYKEERDFSDMKIRTYSLGTYTCGENGTEWTCLSPGTSIEERNLEDNLEDLTINNVSYKMYFPLPSENSFPFRGGVTQMDLDSSYVAFDENGNRVDLQYTAKVKYSHNGNTHRITFVNKYYEPQEYCTFECKDGETSWTKIK